MEPDRVVERGHLGVRGIRVVGGERRTEEAHVAGVGEQGEVLDGIVAELAVDADPDPRLRRMGGILLEPVPGVAEEPDIHRGPLLAEPGCLLGAPILHQVEQARAGLGAAHLRHRLLVVEARLGPLKADGLVVDDLAVLSRGHPAGHERASVADPLDVVDDRHVVVAGQQEVRVQRVHVVVRVDGPHRGHQGLRRHLAAVDPLPLAVGLLAAEEVDVEVLQVKETDQVGHYFTHAQPCCSSGPSRPARNCSNCCPISSPVGIGWSPASRLLPDSSARWKASYCCSRERTTSSTSSLADR